MAKSQKGQFVNRQQAQTTGAHQHDSGEHHFGSNRANLEKMRQEQAIAAEGPSAQPTAVSHLSGEDVDTLVSASPFISAYVADKFDASGNGANGNIDILNAAAFRDAWVAYALTKRNSKTQRTYTEAEAIAHEPNINAFQGGGRITIHENRGEVATAIHESVHLFSDLDWLSTVGFNVNEGATEYFTHLLCTEQGINRGVFYTQQKACIEKRVAAVGQTPLAKGFFRGSLSSIESAVNGGSKADGMLKGAAWGSLAGPAGVLIGGMIGIALEQPEHAGRWEQWIALMQASSWREANAQF